MRAVYHEAAVCVLTSDFEGTPNVLLEAMASGLPVVATNVGGVPGIVQHGRTGFLHEPDDLEGLVANVFDLVTNSRLRTEMGQRARAFVEERHNLQRLPAYLSGLYQRAVPTKRHARPQIVPDPSI
jgi:glycosyltransferase involved in cell wall biosynthesis